METYPKETSNNNVALLDNLNKFFFSYDVLLIKQDNSKTLLHSM